MTGLRGRQGRPGGRSRRRQLEDLSRTALARFARTDVCLVDLYFGAKAGVAHSADLFWQLISTQAGVRSNRVVPGRRYPLRLGRPSTVLWLANARDLSRLQTKFPWLVEHGGRHVGYWYFELDRLPSEEAAAAESLDEIWTASRFVADSVACSCSKPVFVIPPPILFSAGKALQRNRPFSLDRRHNRAPKRFLLSLDAYSSVERKNPWLAAEAFREVFAGRADAELTIRVSRPEGLSDELRRRLLDLRSPQITVHFQTFERGDEARRFMAEHDVYLSPHRSEGLGLHLAEAILLDMPVVATAYGGSVDFCDPAGVDLIDYDLVPGHDPQNLYQGDFRWAQPRFDSMCKSLEAVYQRSPEEARERRERARRGVERHFATERIVSALAERLVRS